MSEQGPARLSALILDDDPHFRRSMEAMVRREGFRVTGVDTLAGAREALERSRPDLVMLDLQLPDGVGLELLQEETAPPAPEYVVLTGHATVESVIEGLRAGALDYLTKPVDQARLKTVLAHVARNRGLRTEVLRLQEELCELGRFGPLVGSSPAMKAVYGLIQRVAPTGATVLITGESGTGKELAAQTIHQHSPRRDEIFLPVNCGAIPPTLIESELFGHERGSFTGASQSKPGMFERADGGSLFLDEITEMPLELQVKLLRVLETGQVVRIGSSKPVAIDVRVIAATNQNPEAAVQGGRLREDIYYRLNVFPLALPPLRERGDDARFLARHFLEILNREMGAEKCWTRPALEKIRRHAWPGNVRQLKNAVQRAWILADVEIAAEHVEGEEFDVAGRPSATGSSERIVIPVGVPVSEAERRLILATLSAYDGDKKRAAKALGMSLKTLYNRLNAYSGRPEAERGPARRRP